MDHLPKLLSAADRVPLKEETDDDLPLLLAPGSSLGGARPKASVLDGDGKLSIATFPCVTDQWSVVLWDAVALSLARRAGIEVPRSTTRVAADRPVLLLERFDRREGARIPFLSAMSMLNAEDPLRNHGFLCEEPDGWRLAPAYDLNPTPLDVRPRVLSTEIDVGEATASLEIAFGVAKYFRISPQGARQMAREVGDAVSRWRTEADGMGIGRQEIERMASARLRTVPGHGRRRRRTLSPSWQKAHTRERFSAITRPPRSSAEAFPRGCCALSFTTPNRLRK